MYKNKASYVEFEVKNKTTGTQITGDAANITMYASLDGGTVRTLTGNTTYGGAVTEIDATHLPGWYSQALTAAGTNGNSILFGGGTTTTNGIVQGRIILTNYDVNKPRVDGH